MPRDSFSLFNPQALDGAPLSVASYLELVNIALGSQKAKIAGEISQVKVASSGHVYFSLKDERENAVLECVMWRTNYRMSGIALEVGMAVAVSGAPGIYAPTGRFSFKADTLELVGEGALKKQYDELKRKLEREGLFAPERKRDLPEYPQKIGVITSKHGAVIHDFLNNLGRFGFEISMIDSRVEGAQATPDLLSAMRAMRARPIDLLVIIRGGGSLESLIAFNNEALVREIASFPVPVCVGIGHDQDVPLAALVADAMGSTPTAVAHLVNASWEAAQLELLKAERTIVGAYDERIQEVRLALARHGASLARMLAGLAAYYKKVESAVRVSVAALAVHIGREKSRVDSQSRSIVAGFRALAERVGSNIAHLEKSLALSDPRRQLALGYAIARSGDKVVRSAKDAKAGDHIEILLADGTVDTIVQSSSQ